MPTTTVLTHDATTLREAILAAALALHGPRTRPDPHGQRFVPLVTMRAAVDLPADRFDAAVRELAGVHWVWLRVNWTSDAADDRASVLRNGTSYHDITADDWRDETVR